MIFDGKAFAARRREALLEERKRFGPLTLGVVAAAGNPVTDSYVRIKERNALRLNIALTRYPVPQVATTEDVLRLVHDASACDGIIVQLPLPPDIDSDAVLAAIPPDRDVDALSGGASVLPPVVAAIDAIITAECMDSSDKKVTVVGKGRLVGKPAARYFQSRGAQVDTFEKGDDIAPHTKQADIVVLGAGSPHFLKPDMVKRGVVILDAGTSEAGNAVMGDAHPAVAEKASFFTPVPGGIGPVAVVEIFGNLFKLKSR